MENKTIQISFNEYNLLVNENKKLIRAITERKSVEYTNSVIHPHRYIYVIEDNNELADIVNSHIKILEECLKIKDNIIKTLDDENTRLKQRKKRWLW